MDPDKKVKWLVALRSGTYTQERGRLYAGSTVEGVHKCCCLGVYEHISGNALENLLNCCMPRELGMQRKSEFPGIMDPEAIKIIINKIRPGKFENTNNSWEALLAAMNDNGCSFEEIANIIEKYL